MITVSTMLLVVAVNTLRHTEAENWGPGTGTGARMEWLRRQGARDAARYVRPGQPTALLPPPAGLCAGSPPPQLLLAVPSAVANRERRDAVRETWGRALRNSSRLLFVTGHSGDGRLQEELIAEALVNGDMLVEDMVDTYDNLTVKTLLMLKWTADHCSHVSYVVKVRFAITVV
ncbi:acetylgalactosaminyl-O-glycosyl-glycoprotein beta-1,3-N-acetylglucosaminyltransferase-like [Schistocerca gregaria]|uniref:acetylgalactosaminyl-O-glycosyl-glycoprotein beta-1,3-N-acetylglucosaminyltransferase-like n=1 Tax=Schistocerca gregaria TaxID=7010 RepID=UPI00211F3C16|nr:acetylgalactosaminyl-O-glycosyl-glycoprotein beta-1,3-N-acetylglucosaminyltransferase-like [Schistocerca gregaria]